MLKIRQGSTESKKQLPVPVNGFGGWQTSTKKKKKEKRMTKKIK